MAFINTLLNPNISYGFSGGPEYNTTRVELPNGRIYRNINRDLPIYRYSASYDAMQYELGSAAAVQAAYEGIVEMFHRTRGAHSFRFRDFMDYTLDSELIGTGDGVTTAFQIIKTYGSSDSMVRTITKPITASEVFGWTDRTPVTVSTGASPTPAHTINASTGIVTFTVAPSAATPIRVSGHFDVPVMFDQDDFSASYSTFRIGGVRIELVEDTNA